MCWLADLKQITQPGRWLAEVFTWGRGEYGRLGLGDRQGGSKLRAQAVPGLGGPQHCVVQASCGGTHTLVLTAQVGTLPGHDLAGLVGAELVCQGLCQIGRC